MPKQFDLFINDKRVKNSIYSLVDQLLVYQRNLRTIKDSDSRESISYTMLLEDMAKCKGQSLFFPYLSSGLGRGALVELADGSVKYDFISGIGVHWSHSDPDLVKASIKAALMDTVMQGNLQQHAGSVELYKLLTELSGFDHVFLTSSGVMAWENAVKIAFHYKKNSKRILSFKGVFSGRTITAAQVTDKPDYRKGLPASVPVDYIPFYDSQNKLESIQRSVTMLKEYLNRFPGEHACMVFELIQGEGGFNVGSRSFFVELMTILKKADIPIYVDEIQTFGRTPDIFAYKMFGLEDFVDIVSIGKLSQVCATLFNSKLNPEKGLLSQTFTSSTTAIESAKVILNALRSTQYSGKTGKIARLHGYFARGLRKLFKENNVQDFDGPFGVGSMIAFEIFQGNSTLSLKFVHRLYANGVISFLAGSSRKRIRFLLPVAGIETHDIDVVLNCIDKTYKEIKKEEHV